MKIYKIEIYIPNCSLVTNKHKKIPLKKSPYSAVGGSPTDYTASGVSQPYRSYYGMTALRKRQKEKSKCIYLCVLYVKYVNK